MKKFNFACLFLFVLISCSKDEDIPSPTNVAEEEKPNLSGIVDGKKWIFKHGFFTSETFDTTYVGFTLMDTLNIYDSCSIVSETNLLINTLPGKVGVYKLDTIPGEPTFTFFTPRNNNNYIATSGTIEIISIDTIKTNLIKGRMDVFYDSSFYVNGYFNLHYCRE